MDGDCSCDQTWMVQRSKVLNINSWYIITHPTSSSAAKDGYSSKYCIYGRNNVIDFIFTSWPRVKHVAFYRLAFPGTCTQECPWVVLQIHGYLCNTSTSLASHWAITKESQDMVNYLWYHQTITDIYRLISIYALIAAINTALFFLYYQPFLLRYKQQKSAGI